MLTINRIAAADYVALRVIAALHRAWSWLDDRHETTVMNAAYRVVEKQAAAISKAEDKISDLEDNRAELVAYGVEARIILQHKYIAALDALHVEIVTKEDKINAGLAAAAEELVAATKAYEQVQSEALDKLGLEVGA